VVSDDEVAKESGQAEVTTLGDVPALGRVFKKGAELEKAARDLSAVQLERSDDTKALSERGRSLGESALQSSSRVKEDKGVLAELPVEEYESLTAVIDEALPAPKSDQQQRLEEKDADERRNRPTTRKPKSSTTANRELLRRKGEAAGNKKRPATATKPQSASRSLRLPEAKRVEKQLVEKLKEVEPQAKPTTPSVVYTPRPETVSSENNFSTFSLNVSDVSFKTALASLQGDKLPEPADVRSEEFLNALEYRDPMPRAGEPLAFHWERARSPFTHDRDIVRFSVRTAALGRQPGRAVNLVCLLDNSGSMEREDRVSIVKQALGVLARKLTPNDRVSLVTFSRTPKLRIDGLRGGNREAFLKASTGWIPQGGTHVANGLALAYETAKKHFIAGGNNRVILLTDGAANMGNVDPYQLRKTVESHRKQGIALDCFGIGWEGYNDNLLEVLARNGDGRYGFLNQPAQAVAEFEQKLLGAFQVAASDVKVQVEWNAGRVKVFRQVGYLRHQLKKEDFRNNKIDAAEISAAESGNALYVVQVNPDGEGPLGVVRVRYKVPFTREYTELEWSLAYEPAATPLEQAGPAMRLGSVAATFAEWLAKNPYAQGVELGDLQGLISGIPSIYATDPRPAQLEWMIGKARILAGN
jgi:Mg-chelatase subunit ChlD